jgi:hypothetical protein
MFKLTEGILKVMSEDTGDVSPELLARAKKRLKENPNIAADDKDNELVNYLAQHAVLHGKR